MLIRLKMVLFAFLCFTCAFICFPMLYMLFTCSNSKCVTTTRRTRWPRVTRLPALPAEAGKKHLPCQISRIWQQKGLRNLGKLNPLEAMRLSATPWKPAISIEKAGSKRKKKCKRTSLLRDYSIIWKSVFFFFFQTTGKQMLPLIRCYLQKKAVSHCFTLCVLAVGEIIIATDTIFYIFFFKWLLLNSRGYEEKISLTILFYLG